MFCPAPKNIHNRQILYLLCNVTFPTTEEKKKIPKTGKAEKQEGNLEHKHNGTAWNTGPSIPACSLLILVSAPPAPALFPRLIPSQFACPIFLSTPCLLQSTLPSAPQHPEHPCSHPSPSQPREPQNRDNFWDAALPGGPRGWGALPVSKETGEIYRGKKGGFRDGQWSFTTWCWVEWHRNTPNPHSHPRHRLLPGIWGVVGVELVGWEWVWEG